MHCNFLIEHFWFCADTLKGSFYANPIFDIPTANGVLVSRYDLCMWYQRLIWQSAIEYTSASVKILFSEQIFRWLWTSILVSQLSLSVKSWSSLFWLILNASFLVLIMIFTCLITCILQIPVILPAKYVAFQSSAWAWSRYDCMWRSTQHYHNWLLWIISCLEYFVKLSIYLLFTYITSWPHLRNFGVRVKVCYAIKLCKLPLYSWIFHTYSVNRSAF